jgi:RimJ/RimL family protein N-acetyltransferase
VTQTCNEFGQPIGFPVPGWSPPPWPSRIILKGRLCRLEPLNPDGHVPALFTSISTLGASFWTYLPYGPFSTLRDYRGWIDTSCLGNDPLFFTIIDLTDEEPVGLASYLRIAPESGSIEVGHLHFGPRLQKTAAATEAMYLLMRHAFELGYRRYEWKCDSLNAPSRAAALRLGFKFEGIFRQAIVYKNRNRDTAWFSVTDSEWPTVKNAFEQWLAPDNFDDAGRQRTRLSDLRHH